jgi:hypothetical protein
MITPSFGLTATERVLPRLALDWTTGLAQTGVDVARAGVATFVGSNGLIQSATENTQRIDYSTGTPGLLVEESRTNLATASEDLTDTGAWASLSEQTITANQATAPDGTLTADRVDVGVAGVSSRTFQTVTSVTGTTYTASFWLWADEGEAASVNLQIVNTSNTTLGTLIAVLSTTPTRFFVSGVADSTSIRIQLRARQSDKSFYAWGAQLEAGAFPTSYIPTEATAVTRNADVATMTGTNFSDWYNPVEGTLFVRSVPAVSSFGANKVAFALGDNTQSNFIALRYTISGGTTNFGINAAGSLQANLSTGAFTGGVAHNVIGAYKADSAITARDGGVPLTDDTVIVPTVDTAFIGALTSVPTFVMSGHIQKIMYWPYRLTNAEVQAFSK